MNKIYGVTRFSITHDAEGAQPVGCVIMSARAAVLAIDKSLRLQWYCHILKLDPVYDIGFGYMAIGFSPVTGCMVAVKKSELSRFAVVNFENYFEEEK